MYYCCTYLEVIKMCCGLNYRAIENGTCCCDSHMHRQFLTKEEKIEILENYKKELEREIHGLQKRIQEIKE